MLEGLICVKTETGRKCPTVPQAIKTLTLKAGVFEAGLCSKTSARYDRIGQVFCLVDSETTVWRIEEESIVHTLLKTGRA